MGDPTTVAAAPPSFPHMTPQEGLPPDMSAAQGGSASGGSSGPVARLFGAAASAPLRQSQFSNKSNWRETFAQVTRGSTHVDTSASTERQVLWTKRDNGNPPPGRGGLAAQTPLVVTTPVLNFLFAMLAQRAEAAGTLYNTENPDIVWEHYTFRGVGVTEQGSDRYPGPRPNIRSSEKVVNAQVGGFVTMHNVFGCLPKSGAKLYAVVRLENVAGKVYNLGADAVAQHKHIRDGQALWAWQITMAAELTASGREDTDPSGALRPSSVNPIGRAGNIPASRHTGAVVMQPPSSEVEVFRAVTIPVILADNTP